MTSASKYHHGVFVWRELMSGNVNESKRFYSEVFGWKMEDFPMGDFQYTVIKANDRQIGGMMPKQPGMEHSAWLAYVSVADVDKAASEAKKAGGTVIVEPKEIPNVGRFSILADPQGGVITAFRDAKEDRVPDGRPAVGEFCWEQLSVAEPSKVKSFYQSVIGWTFEPFGEMVVAKAGEKSVASLNQAPPNTPSQWLSFVSVDKLSSARERVKRNGGVVLMDEITVKEVGSFAVCKDNQNAVICLFESSM